MSGVAYQIEREIFIEAGPDIVWRAVNDPQLRAVWFADAAVIDQDDGGTLVERVELEVQPEGAGTRVRVVERGVVRR